MKTFHTGNAKPRGRPGRPPGRKNSGRYREGVAREVLTLRIPPDATPEVHALGEEARSVIRRALRTSDPKAFCKPRVLAAIYVLRHEIARPQTALDVLADIAAEADRE